jgi:hypothetical protein
MHRFFKRPAAILIGLVLAISLAMPAAAYHLDDGTQHPRATQAFEERWERTDRPVYEDIIDRTWMWGPRGFTTPVAEPYADSPDGIRIVQYTDKSRLEIIDPTGNPDDLWFVTNGLLVVEMVNGRFQAGDDAWDHSPDPAHVRIVGDPDEIGGPFYSDINRLGLRHVAPLPEGTLITHTIREDQVMNVDDYAQYGVHAAYRVQVDHIDHTVPDVFWNFLNSDGLVYVDGDYFNDRLFLNPFYQTGYPITEAYWATVLVDGFPTDVLWQCFERQCLSYTPSNPDGWQVEAGNVGQHYYEWRYGDDPFHENFSMQLVAVGDPAAGHMPFGCDDSLVGVDRQIMRQATVEHDALVTLYTLFSTQHENLYNVFDGAHLYVESVSVDDGTAVVNLHGDLGIVGVCDNPRVEYQIEQTLTINFPQIDNVVILHHGEPLDLGQQ